MKKITLLLLLLVTTISLGQTTLATKLRITGNATSATAVKVNVQEANGDVNTKPLSEFGTVTSVTAIDGITVATGTTTPVIGINSIAQAKITGLVSDLAAKEPVIVAGTTLQYWRGDKTWQALNKAAVGLSYVDNTSDINKPISAAQQTALDLKVDKVEGGRLINASEIIKLSNQSGVNTGDQDLGNLVVKNAPIAGATNTKITYDSKGLVTGGASLIAADVPTLNQNTTGTASTITGNITESQVTGLQTALDSKVDKVAGERLLNASEIIKLSNQSGTNTGDQDLSGYATNANLNLKENAANKNIANGYAGLGGDGKLISSQLPSITISDTFVTASQAAMLALTAETGDVAVRTDLNKSFILKGTNPTVLADWQELLTPTSAVTTVFGRNGAVTAQTGDYTADQITETATRKFQTATQNTVNDATSSIQTQLNGKQASLGFTPYNATNPAGYISSFTESDPSVPAYSKSLSTFSVIKSSTDALYEPLFAKLSAFNKNFGTASGTVAEGNDSRILNGQTAFGWGNHAGLYSPISGSTNYIQNQNASAQSASMWISGGIRTGSQSVIPDNIDIFYGNVNTGVGIGQYFSPPDDKLKFYNGVGGGNILEIHRNTGAAAFSSTVTAPTFIGALTGNAATASNSTQWNGQENDYSTFGTSLDYLVGKDIPTNKTKPFSSTQIKTWLGLGSNAYTSTDFLPLMGGSLYGQLTAQHIIAVGTSNAYTDGGVEIRGNGASIHPTLGFHTPGQYAGSLRMTANAQFKFLQGDNSSLADVYASTFYGNATTAATLQVVGYNGTNLNTAGVGKYVNYSNGWNSQIGGPSNAQYGTAYNLGGDSSSILSLQLLADVNHNSTSSTKDLYFRTGNNLGFQNDWKTVLHSGNFGNYALPLAGGSLSGQLTLSGNSNQIQFAAAVASDLYISAIPGTRILEIRNGNATEPNYGACGLITGSGNFTNGLMVGSGARTGALVGISGISIGDSDTGFMQDGDGVLRTYANNTLVKTEQSTGVNFNLPINANSTITSASTMTATGFFNSSDKRLKDIIKRDGDVAYFKWKDKRDTQTHIGYIAQEVKKEYPDQVKKGEDGYFAVNYIEVLVAKIQALEKRITELENKK